MANYNHPAERERQIRAERIRQARMPFGKFRGTPVIEVTDLAELARVAQGTNSEIYRVACQNQIASLQRDQRKRQAAKTR